MKTKFLTLSLLMLLTAAVCHAQEPYAVLSGDTLTFYCDNNEANTGQSLSSDTWWLKDSIKVVVFDKSIQNYHPVSCKDWFRGFSNLKAIEGLTYLNTEDVYDMSFMFSKCSNLNTLDLSHFDTRNVTDMSRMFEGCSKLETLDLSHFDTRNVTDMNGMFIGCSKLETLDLRHFDTRNVTYMNGMFSGCQSLKTLDLSSFVVKEEHVSGGPTLVNGIFDGCVNLKTIFAYDWEIFKSQDLFSGCKNLIGGNGTEHFYYRYSDRKFAHVDSDKNPGYFTRPGAKPYISSLRPYAIMKDSVMIFYYGIDKTGKGKKLNDLATNDILGVKKVVFDPSFKNYKPSTLKGYQGFFANFKNLTEIVGMDKYLNTAGVTNFEDMFSYCESLEEIDLSNFEIRRGVQYNMDYMFKGCYTLQTIYVSNKWLTKVYFDSSGMFESCGKLYGGQGTKYEDGNWYNSSYAHVDGGDNNPGFFTLKGHKYNPKEYLNTENITDLSDIPELFTMQQQPPYAPAQQPVEETAKPKPVEQRPEPNPVVQKPAEQKPIEPKLYKIVKDKTLIYYYDTNFVSSNYDWQKANNIETVVFDKSCAKYKPRYLSYFFSGLGNLTKIVNMQKFLNTENVENMESMFSGCEKLEEIDLSNFDTRKVNNMTDMFYECHSLKTVYIGENWHTEGVCCYPLWFNDFKRKDQKTKTIGYAILKDSVLTFYSGKKVPDGAFSLHEKRYSPDWKNSAQEISKVVFHKSFKKYFPTSCYEWFSGCCRLREIVGIRENLNTQQVTNMRGMFLGCSSLKNIDLSGFNISNVTDMTSMFDCCLSLENLDLSSFDTKNVKYMAFMFEGCQNLKTLDLSTFNTSNVKTMGSMFMKCYNLTNINLTNFNTSSCFNMSYMFGECFKLANIDLSSFDTHNIENKGFGGMFEGCESLTDLDVSNFTVQCNTNIEGMFMGCCNLKNLNLFELNGDDCYDEHWSGSMSSIFNGCKSLETIDLSGWNIGQPSSMNRTFANCSSLKTIYVSNNWTMDYKSWQLFLDEEENIIEKLEVHPSDFYHVFYNCPNLTGGAGTKWNPKDVSTPAYLRIDVPSETTNPAVPGYFTKKE